MIPWRAVPATILLSAVALAQELSPTVAASPQQTISPIIANFPEGSEAAYVFRFSKAPSEIQAVRERTLITVTESGRPLMLAGDTFIPLPLPGDLPNSELLQPIRLSLPEPASHIAVMRDGAILLVSGHQLGVVTANGWQKLTDLPASRMKVVPATTVQAYLYGGDSVNQRRHVYLYRKDGKILHLFEAPAPVTAVDGFGDLTFVAVGKTIFFMRLGEPLLSLYEASDEVIALAALPPNGIVFSTPRSVNYLHKDEAAWEIMNRAAIPYVRGEALFLIDVSAGDLIRCTPVSAFDHSASSLLEARAKNESARFASLPDAARPSFEEGLVAVRQRAWRRAIQAFGESQKLAPYAPAVLFNLGMSYAERGRELPAIAWLEAYLAAVPNPSDADRVRREIARLSTKVERKVRRISAASQQMHDELERIGVRPGTIRQYARLGAQIAIINNDAGAAEAAIAAVQDITDRDEVWADLALALGEWPADLDRALAAASKISDPTKRDTTVAQVASHKMASPPADGSVSESLRIWEAFARFVSGRSEGRELDAELKSASGPAAEVPIRVMAVATEYGSDYLRIRNLQKRYSAGVAIR
jgi:tetratricopeptide (TPR) repeat protein